MIVAHTEHRSNVGKLRLASQIEASTLITLLLVAVPAKHFFGLPIATRIMGPVHGAAFVAYIWCVIAMVSGDGNWTRRDAARLIVTAFIPFGGFANSGYLRRKEASFAFDPERR
ncbi:DUF3817 domain-containing protein [Sphingomonas sp. PvP056]|uniref:DUF3817 domain-containing protein n=1 Tax=Sphingomonas sp. PvP056 TaxID=3156392 RepID=UPI003391FB68